MTQCKNFDCYIVFAAHIPRLSARTGLVLAGESRLMGLLLLAASGFLSSTVEGWVGLQDSLHVP